MPQKLTFMQKIGYMLYPNRCAFCDDVIVMSRDICERCEDELPRVEGKICAKCGCEKKYCKCGSALQFDRAAAPFYYESPFNNGLMKFKRNREKWRADVFAKHMGETLRCAFAGERIDFAVRVPDHERRINDNVCGPRIGYGISHNLTLAAAVCENCGIELRDGVIAYCDGYTESQRGAGKYARFANVFGSFDVAVSPEELFGKNILLIDDVLTTGATASECAKMLKLYGADKVFCLTLFTTKQEKRV